MNFVGLSEPQPWHFLTANVRNMISEALDVAHQAVPGADGVNEIDLLIAVNNLRHSADELERSLIEKKYGVRRAVGGGRGLANDPGIQ